MKKVFSALMAAVLAVGLMAGCSQNSSSSSSGNGSSSANGSSSSSTTSSSAGSDFDASNEITVISREASSGTRSAFDELMNIVVEQDDGSTVDNLFAEAVLVNSTDEVSSKVEVDEFAIGYTSLGSVTDAVKAVSVDGVEATIDNVKSGDYKISRPFMLATNDQATDLAKDFLAYVTSQQGQAVVTEEGYITAVDDAAEYTASGLSGKLTLSGSTSVEGVIEKLKEEYIALNPDVTIEITYSGSGAGIKDVTEGKVDIGMSSRALSEDEQATLTGTQFASDGIAVIVNVANPVDELTSEQITAIFTGESRNWSDIIG